MTFFIAGIIQGSLPAGRVHRQGYRARIKRLLTSRFPDCRVIDPLELHPGSVHYGPRKGRATFFEHVRVAARADVVVSYLPRASMGTAVEMFNAFTKRSKVITISPMKGNWAVEFLSHHVCPDLKSFAAFLDGGGLSRLMKPRYRAPFRFV